MSDLFYELKSSNTKGWSLRKSNIDAVGAVGKETDELDKDVKMGYSYFFKITSRHGYCSPSFKTEQEAIDERQALMNAINN